MCGGGRFRGESFHLVCGAICIILQGIFYALSRDYYYFASVGQYIERYIMYCAGSGFIITGISGFLADNKRKSKLIFYLVMSVLSALAALAGIGYYLYTATDFKFHQCSLYCPGTLAVMFLIVITCSIEFVVAVLSSFYCGYSLQDHFGTGTGDRSGLSETYNAFAGLLTAIGHMLLGYYCLAAQLSLYLYYYYYGPTWGRYLRFYPILFLGFIGGSVFALTGIVGFTTVSRSKGIIGCYLVLSIISGLTGVGQVGYIIYDMSQRLPLECTNNFCYNVWFGMWMIILASCILETGVSIVSSVYCKPALRRTSSYPVTTPIPLATYQTPASSGHYVHQHQRSYPPVNRGYI